MSPVLRLLPLALAASAAGAQSVPGAAAKLAAQNAVAATNAHTIAMSAPDVSSPAMTAAVRTATPSATPAAMPNAAASGAPDATPHAGGASASSYATRPSSRASVPASAASRVAAVGPDSAPGIHAGKNVMSFTRETFSYAGGGRRDPFSSLMQKGGDLRPVFNDLRLVTIVVDNGGRNSVAILRDLTTKEQYRVRVGQVLGRMRVAQIEPRQVVFTIEEFGYSRQETLMYNDPTTTRSR